MTSNDNQQFVTVEVSKSELEELHYELANIRKEFKEVHAEIQAVREIAIVNSAKIEMLQHTFYWGFGIMTIILAVVAIFVPYILRERKEVKQEQSQPTLTEQKVQDMINVSISQAVDNAITKALSNSGVIGK